jgi:hypothetical protein
MTENNDIARDNEAEWKPLDSFGNGIIYGCGNERKVVTPGMADFIFQIKRLPTLVGSPDQPTLQ